MDCARSGGVLRGAVAAGGGGVLGALGFRFGVDVVEGGSERDDGGGGSEVEVFC